MKIKMCVILIVLMGLCAAGAGCNSVEILPQEVPLAEQPEFPAPLAPEASGIRTQKNDKAEIDYSNTDDGYIMVRYLNKTSKAVKVLVKEPEGVTYTYALSPDEGFSVYPLSNGSGSYQVGVYENTAGSKYALALSVTVEAKLNDEFAPFIRPNKYVDYTENSIAVKKASEVTRDKELLLEKITAVYRFVTDNITYDRELAASVQSGYVPDLDAVLERGKGICFDYAAVTTAMLRSQRIPAKLVIGYTGELCHAWINVYSEETGWIDSIIFFDGVSWQLMDPTFAAGASSKEQLRKYVGDSASYNAKYLY